ncbi:hypothetical protein LSTR_LSTR005456 [Laodelphax striatellus]|uniref:Guanylate cyclase domain-containing protein n=1 Tax=Laodelphax striatellus TaxID=195883 RepID=A0A482WX97_LAOST|nr:hypothetical protein LSTR_LSTR005456 [Laodelphax striatellus]
MECYPNYDVTPFKASTVEALWRKNILSEKIPSKEWENYTDSMGDSKSHIQMGLLEMALLSEKVVMNRVAECTLSPLQTEILATLVPDELIDQPCFQGKPKSKFVGVLMFGDVSGFTALCETYKNMGQSGTYKLTVTLNSYIGAMVDVIYSFGGDIIKFSGDAFLAVWKVTIDDYIFSVIHKAIQCAISIQYSLGSYNTEVNVLLRVKLAISCGNLIFSCIGENNCKYYVIYGLPVDDVKVAQDLCKSGDIILAASAWNHCSIDCYLYTWVDKRHIKIDRIVYHPLEMHNKIVPLPIRERIDIDKKYKNEILRFKNIGNTETNAESNYVEEKSCRPEVKKAADRNIGAHLRQFVIPPVVAQIDAEQPLEYLTEMRQTTTVFVNLVLEKEEASVFDIINRVDEVYTIIWQIVYKEMGVVNKVCMFDKDVMFLVIFGLRGARHEYNAVRSLKCAHRIRSVISKLTGVLSISCGVSVGTTYCGVVGHPLRQEYTIIGAPVNKAARMMVYYPNIVSCDQATFFNSGLSTVHFRPQESKTLKGLGKVVGIYEYLEGQGMAEMKNLQMPVLLGMQTEVESFRQLLAGEKGFPVGIIYSGETGVGKTRLLTELSIVCVDSHLRPVFLTLNASQVKKPYIVLRYLYREIFELSSDAHISSVADKMDSLYKDTDLEMFVSLLNPVFNLDLPSRLPKNHDYSDMELTTIQKKLLSRLVELTALNLAIFIDNMDYCDPKSVEVIQMFLSTGNCIVAMSCNRTRSTKVMRWFPGVHSFELENLEECLLPALACQILNVRAIPRTVHLLICKHAEASPGWCQRYLQSLIDSKAIQVVKMHRNEIDKMDNMIVPDYNLLLRRIICQETNPKRIISVHLPALQETFDSEVDICILESAEAIDETVPASIEAIIMSAFDSLQPFEQLLLKCAAVIGDIFPRDFLVAMLQNKSKIMVATATKRLYEMHILCCYNEMQREKSQSIDSRIYDTCFTVEPVCSCPNIDSSPDLSLEYRLPNFAFCKEIAFTLPLFRQKTYDLLPLNQKQMFHTRAAKYLESLLKSETAVDDIGQSDFKFVDICTAFTYRPLIYDQLIRHTRNGVILEKEVHCMIEYAQYSILRNSPRRALTHLENVIDLVQSNNEIRETLDVDNLIFKARTLAAEAHIQMDNSFVAKIDIKDATMQQKFMLFDHRFINLKTKFNERLVLVKLRSMNDRSILNKYGKQNKDKALCFTISCCIAMMEGDLAMARLLALKSVHAALNSREATLADLFISLANLLDVSCLLGNFSYCDRILVKGQSILNARVNNGLNTDFVAEEIAVGKFISTAFKVKLLEGKLIPAFELGKSAELSADECQAEAALLWNRCFCILIAIHLKKLEQAVHYLKKLRCENKEMSLTCYHLFSTYLTLYTGLVEESPHRALEEVHRSLIDLERPLAIVLGLFYIRRDEIYRYKFIEQMLVPDEVTMYNAFFEIMLLEFLIIRMVRKNDSKRWDKKRMASELSHIAAFCLSLWNVVKDRVLFLQPRFFLMMAYFHRIFKAKSLSDMYLNKAESQSQRLGDMLESEWISHNRMSWSHDEDEMFCSWLRHSSRLRHVSWKEHESPLYYPLPLPKEPINVTMNMDVFNPIFDGAFR